VTAPIVVVRTKADVDAPSAEELAASARRANAATALAVSAESGAGLQALLDAIVALVLASSGTVDVDAPMLTHERHTFAVTRALDEVRAFRERWTSGDVPAPVAAVHLREAVNTLEDLVGSIDVEDVLDEVFRRFCVGK
jgi:tRNA modification GTPase